MSKLCFIIFLFLFISSQSQAQYYYKDIVSNNQVVTEMATYRENKIHSVKINSFEADGSTSQGFFCEKKISKDYRKAELFTRSDLSGSSIFTSVFNEKGYVLFTTDSSVSSVSHNSYYYDAKGRVARIVSSIRSSDDDFQNEILEEHIYTYDEENLPVRMIRIKNNADSSTILFSADENKNVSVEKDAKADKIYYYYYNPKKQLTDVVRFNEFKQKLLPDYLFEYNPGGQLTQMTTTEESGNNYYIWKYAYDNGLRSREKVFSKEKKLLGGVEYEYN